MKFENKTALFPFSPAKSPVFYGWIILAVSAVATVMSIPGQTMGVSVFTDFLIDVLKISRVNLSTAYLVGTLGSALVLPFMGKLYDKSGARLMGTLVVVGLGAILLGFSYIGKIMKSLSDLLYWLPRGVLAFTIIGIGFFLLRFLGQGMLAMIARNMSMKWFDRNRGKANAVLGTVISFGFSFAPRLLNAMIEGRGWRGAYRLEALIIGVVFSLIFFLLARDNPQTCNLLPDGETAKSERVRKADKNTKTQNLTLTEARRQLTFWIYTLTLTLFSLFGTGLTFHIVSIFNENGLDRVMAVKIFLPMAVISVIVNFVASWASDYIRLKYFLLIELIALCISMTALLMFKMSYAYILLIIGHGVVGGLFGLLSTVSWPKFFGTEHLGAITGFTSGIMVAGSAVGPLLFSVCYKYLGSYSYAGLFCLIVTIILFILSISAKDPYRDR
jgi:MFS transporter, OFA family, oxalate/formate antiporter